MNGVKYFAAVILGATAGSVATWFFTKKYYAQIAQEEIDSVKEVFSKRAADISEIDDTKRDLTPEEIEKHDYSDLLNRNRYIPKEEVMPMKEERPPVYEEEPYVIDPDEFGTMFDYDQIELTYFADGVLTDDWNYPIDNPVELVGEDFAEHFGENEDEPDAVYIRNDQKKSEYVIYTDERNSTEVIKYGSNEVEME